jgi:hypothetical protein
VAKSPILGILLTGAIGVCHNYFRFSLFAFRPPRECASNHRPCSWNSSCFRFPPPASPFVVSSLAVLALTVGTAQAQICPGCVDDSTGAPTADSVDEVTFNLVDPVFGTSWNVGTASYVMTVEAASGLCSIQTQPIPHSHITVCAEYSGCTPHVMIEIFLEDALPAYDMHYDVSAGGTVCNVGLPDGSMPDGENLYWRAFDQEVRVPCGTLDCPINVVFRVDATADQPWPFDPVEFDQTFLRAGSNLSCTTCAVLPF